MASSRQEAGPRPRAEDAGCALAGALPALESHAAATALGAPRPSALGAVLLGCTSLGPNGMSRPWCLVVGAGVAGVRLCEVCFNLISIAVQTLGVFSEGCSLSGTSSLLPAHPGLFCGVAVCVHWTVASHCWLCPQCQNLHDSEHLTWLIVNHIQDLINLSHEPPVQDFISAIHRNSAASGLFIQAIQSRCENLSTVSLLGAGRCAFSLPEEWSIGIFGFSCCGMRARACGMQWLQPPGSRAEAPEF